MSTPRTAFAITDTRTGESFTYVPGDGPCLAANYPNPNDSTTYALEAATDALDTGDLPGPATLELLALAITPEAATAVVGGVL